MEIYQVVNGVIKVYTLFLSFIYDISISRKMYEK